MSLRVATAATSSSIPNHFSTKATPSTPSSETVLQHKLLQRLCWEAYLASGRGSTTLFKSIDIHSTGYISREDLVIFLNSVDGKGVNPKAFQILDVLADDHRIDLKEFKSWLIIATKFGRTKNSVYKASLDEHPHLGERQVSQYAEFSWNEVTMSQSLRRMQVRRNAPVQAGMYACVQTKNVPVKTLFVFPPTLSVATPNECALSTHILLCFDDISITVVH